MIEAQAGGNAPWCAYAQRLLDPGSRLYRWPRPGGHDDKVRDPRATAPLAVRRRVLGCMLPGRRTPPASSRLTLRALAPAGVPRPARRRTRPSTR